MGWFTMMIVNGQVIEIRIKVTPPYPQKVNDYIQRTDKVLVTIRNTDQKSGHNIYLTGNFHSTDGKIRISTDPVYNRPKSTNLSAGQIFRLTPGNLQDVFDGNHLIYKGVTKNDLLTGGLPEGDYEICLQAYETSSGKILSGTGDEDGCSQSFAISDVEPPVVLRPVCSDTVILTNPQSLLISWTKPQGAPEKTLFNLKIIEVMPGYRNVNDAVKSATAPVFLEKNLEVSFYQVGPADPALVKGKTYACIVTAIDPTRKVSFRNHGMSEPCSFTYGSSGHGGGNNILLIVINPPSGEICEGTTATLTVDQAQYPTCNLLTTGSDSRWYIYAGSSPPPLSGTLKKLKILSGGGNKFEIDINSSGTWAGVLNYAALQSGNYGWMELTGFSGSPSSGWTYTTPMDLPANGCARAIYNFGWGAICSPSSNWVYEPPILVMVDPKIVPGSFSITQNGNCGNVDLHIGNSCALDWEWKKNGVPWVPSPLPPPPPYQQAAITFSDVISANTTYEVTFKSGSCPPVVLSKNAYLPNIPDGHICISPQLGTVPCITPYYDCSSGCPASSPYCHPNCWLPVCPGCAADLRLVSLGGTTYSGSNLRVYWSYLDYPYDCSILDPLPMNPSGPLCTTVDFSPSSPNYPYLQAMDLFAGGAWPMTGVIGSTYPSPPLSATRWYKATVYSLSNPNCEKDFYGVVVVCQPPVKPIVSPLSPINVCPPFPKQISLSNQSAFPFPDCFEREYRLYSSVTNSYSNWKSWATLPNPNQFTQDIMDYGKYVLEIKNLCGTAVSDSIIVQPEDIPADILGPCCICAGQPATFVADPINAGDTYLWTSIPAVSISPNNTSSVTISLTTSPTILTLEVTNSNGCKKTIKKEIIICPN